MKPQRFKTISLTFIFCYCLVLLRLFYWQIIKNPELSQKVIIQNYKPTTILPIRGIFYDSQNRPIVLNQSLNLLSLYKPDIKDNLKDLISQIIQSAPLLNLDDINQLYKFSENQNIKWITLKYLFDNTQKQQLQKPGVVFNSTTKRFYPEGELAQDIFGKTNINSIGNLVPDGGLESYYQKQLKGKPGFIWQSKDAAGNTILSKTGWQIDAVNGRNLHTSINRQIQFMTETILKNGINQFSADSGSISILKPSTGSIIAMASFVATSSATASANKNLIISDLFEPGSIFKPLVMSMALDSNRIKPDYMCTKCNQSHLIGNYSIGNWDNSFHPNSDLKEIIKNSDNIGMSYIIEDLGLEKFLDYFNRLGLNRKTGIDLQGESKPLNKNYWPEIDLATASFGQGFAITQIQMLSAFNTIANDGNLKSPHVVEYFDNNNTTFPNKQPPAIQVYQPETIKLIKEILQYAVNNGVVSKFKPKSLDVCAKSGTSQIAVYGGYSKDSTIASYIGFSPCENPKFTMLVTINNPKTSPWGSSTAAPIWYDLATKISPLL